MAPLDDSAHSNMKAAMDVEPGSNSFQGKPGKQVEEIPLNLDEEAEGGMPQPLKLLLCISARLLGHPRQEPSL